MIGFVASVYYNERDQRVHLIVKDYVAFGDVSDIKLGRLPSTAMSMLQKILVGQELSYTLGNDDVVVDCNLDSDTNKL